MRPDRPLTPTMLRELRHIVRWGRPGDLEDYHAAEHLAFWARDRVLAALTKRGLIEDAENATEAGRTIADQQGDLT